MLQTDLGKKVAEWSAAAKAAFKADLDQLTNVPPEVLRTVVDKIARTYPACNPLELAMIEMEERTTSDAQALPDVIPGLTYILDNLDDESPEAITSDLLSLEILSKQTSRILTDLLVSAVPFRETAKVASSYLRIGSPLFVGIRGTVDFRLRFHKKSEEFENGKVPTELVGAQRVVLANLTILESDGKERVIPFLMDQNDIKAVKRFLKVVERELELSKGLLKEMEA